MQELNSPVISCDLRLKVGDIVLEVSSASDQRVHFFGLIVQDVNELSLVEDTVFDDLKADELSTFLIYVLREGRHGARLDASDVRVMAT